MALWATPQALVANCSCEQFVCYLRPCRREKNLMWTHHRQRALFDSLVRQPQPRWSGGQREPTFLQCVVVFATVEDQGDEKKRRNSKKKFLLVLFLSDLDRSFEMLYVKFGLKGGVCQ